MKEEQNKTNKFSIKKKICIISIISLIILCLLSVALSLLLTQKKDSEKLIVDINREINQVDYYKATKEQIITIQNSNKTNERNLEEIFENSLRIKTTALFLMNILDKQEFNNGTDLYRAIILLQELNKTNENGEEENIINLDFNESLDLSNFNEEIPVLPLMEIQFYKNGSILNEYYPEYLNESLKKELDFTKEKLIPLISESLYTNNNKRRLEDLNEYRSYEKINETNTTIIIRGVDKELNDSGDIIKDSKNKGTSSVTIVNGTIRNIDTNVNLKVMNNETEDNEVDNDNDNETIHIKLPYQSLSSEIKENITLVNSQINKKITDIIKKLLKLSPNLVDKEYLNEKESSLLEENKEKLGRKVNLRELLSSDYMPLKDDYYEKTIFSISFLGINIELIFKIEFKGGIHFEKSLILYHSSKKVYIINEKKEKNIFQLKNEIIKIALGYKKYLQDYRKELNDLLKNLKTKISSLSQNTIQNSFYDDLELVIDKSNKIFILIDYLTKTTFDRQLLNIASYEDKIQQRNNRYLENINEENEKEWFFKYINDLKNNIPDPDSINKEINNFKTLMDNLEKSITQNILNKKIPKIDASDPIREWNKLESKLRNLDSSYNYGNPLILEILKEIDKMRDDYYNFIGDIISYIKKIKIPYLLEEKIKKILSKEEYKITILDDIFKGCSVDENFKAKIEKIFNRVNDLIKKLKDVCQDIQDIRDIILNIFLLLKEQSRKHIYDSLLNDWKLLLKNTPRIKLFDVNRPNSNKTLFKIDINAFFVTFSLSLKFNSNFNFVVEGFPEPEYYLLSFRHYMAKDASFIFDASISNWFSTGGIEGRINLSEFKYEYKNSINILQYQNEISRYFYYKMPEFVLTAYKKNIFGNIKIVSEVRTPSVKIDINWTKTIPYGNKNEIIQYEDNNEQKSNQQKNWILYNI